VKRLAALALLASAGCVSLPHPTERDVERVQTGWPGASLASLEAGRTLYQTRCGECHQLYAPASHTAAQWAKAIPEMAERAKLSEREQALVLAFLAAMSPPA